MAASRFGGDIKMAQFRDLDPNQFYLGQVDPEELRLTLLDELQQAHWEYGKKGKMIYQIPGTERQLALNLDSQGRIESIKRSTDFPEDRLRQIRDRIRTGLIEGQTPGFNQSIGFVMGTRVGGYFRYKDAFQIIPVPEFASNEISLEKLPRMDQLCPFLLQFAYTNSTDLQVAVRRIKNTAAMYFQLINIFLHDWVFSEDDTSRAGWALDVQVSRPSSTSPKPPK
jgi:hypothetical protein